MTISQPDQGLPADAGLPLLRPLGDPAAAACTDGFCAVPPPEPEPTGADA